MSLLVWATIGLLLGPTAVALLPVLLAWVGGPELRERVGAIYIDRMVNVLGPAAIVAKEQGGLALSEVGTAPKFDADTLVVDGERGHLKDTMGVKDYLKSKPFGIALDSAPAYVSPLLAEFAEAATDARDDGRVGVQPDGGVRLDFEIPRAPQVPDLRQAWRILEGATGIDAFGDAFENMDSRFNDFASDLSAFDIAQLIEGADLGSFVTPVNLGGFVTPVNLAGQVTPVDLRTFVSAVDLFGQRRVDRDLLARLTAHGDHLQHTPSTRCVQISPDRNCRNRPGATLYPLYVCIVYVYTL